MERECLGPSQFTIMLVYRTTEVNHQGARVSIDRMAEVNLVHGDVQAFLNSLPANIDERSVLMAAIINRDGSAVGYADGMTATGHKSSRNKWLRISEVAEAGAGALRSQAITFARRRAAGHTEAGVIFEEEAEATDP